MENKGLAELNRKRKAGEKDYFTITSLPVKKRGRPLLLGEKLDSHVKSYIRAIREGGGVVTTSIKMAAATAIVRKEDRNFLGENGGPITMKHKSAKPSARIYNGVKCN